jgi:hypothetical protein
VLDVAVLLDFVREWGGGVRGYGDDEEGDEEDDEESAAVEHAQRTELECKNTTN